MTFTEMIRRIREMADVEGNLFDDQSCLDAINDKSLDMAEKSKCIESSQFQSIVAAQASYPLPADFLYMLGVDHDKDTLESVTEQKLDRYVYRWRNMTGKPYLYYTDVGAQQVVLVPTPDTPLTDGLFIYYARKPAQALLSNLSLNASSDMPTQFQEGICHGAAARALRKMGDNQQASVEERLYSEAVSRAMSWRNNVDPRRRKVRIDARVVPTRYADLGPGYPLAPVGR
jgi:hypothetical protein